MPRRLFHDEFAELPVGPLPTDFSAIGEYHYAPPAGEMGRWYEPVRGGWGPHAPWVVLEDGGRHRLLQVHQGAAQRGPRLLVAGQSDWADYTLTVRLQPLRTDGWAGVVFRYETGPMPLPLRARRRAPPAAAPRAPRGPARPGRGRARL